MTHVRRHGTAGPGPVRFSIATLVTSETQHREMLATFRALGFDGADVEVLSIDNGGAGQTDAYRGLNAMLTEARGDYVVLCHQDIRLLGHGRPRLEARGRGVDRRALGDQRHRIEALLGRQAERRADLPAHRRHHRGSADHDDPRQSAVGHAMGGQQPPADRERALDRRRA